MNAITVCVEYDDLLCITLEQNRQQFDHYLIVTNYIDDKTAKLAKKHECLLYKTNAFYLNGAVFNKGRAMEEGLETFRDIKEWVCILDADIVLPDNMMDHFESLNMCKDGLYVPFRRIVDPIRLPLSDWRQYPLKEEADLAGYCQIFHPFGKNTRGVIPWYGTTWKHCGGCDTEFEKLFPRYDKHRLRDTVLHLGPDGTNWCGRISDRLDGAEIVGKEERKAVKSEMLDNRKPNYEGERI